MRLLETIARSSPLKSLIFFIMALTDRELKLNLNEFLMRSTQFSSMHKNFIIGVSRLPAYIR